MGCTTNAEINLVSLDMSSLANCHACIVDLLAWTRAQHDREILLVRHHTSPSSSSPPPPLALRATSISSASSCLACRLHVLHGCAPSGPAHRSSGGATTSPPWQLNSPNLDTTDDNRCCNDALTATSPFPLPLRSAPGHSLSIAILSLWPSRYIVFCFGTFSECWEEWMIILKHVSWFISAQQLVYILKSIILFV
jgi:hypothetical protein